MKRILFLLLLLPTLVFADAVIFSGNDVKALKQNLDLFGVVKVMSGNVDPSAGAGVAAPVGSAYLSTTDGLFLKTGVANTDWTKNSLLPVDLTADVTGILPIANGGTGISTTPTNGKLLIGNGTGYTSAGLTGTANQVNVTDGAGSITLSLPQNIHTAATPSFSDVEITSLAYGGTRTVGQEFTTLQSTGVLEGGAMSVHVDPTKFDVASGSGYIVDSLIPSLKTMKKVTWSAQTAIPVTNLATQDVTYVMIDGNGVFSQQSVFPTESERRARIYLGRINHFNRTSISFTNTVPDILQSPISQYYDLLDSLGSFNVDGNVLSANGANLSLNRSSGELFVASYNYVSNNQSPHNVTTAGQTAFSFRYATQTTLAGASTTTLDPTNYDNAGTITTVPNPASTATVQRVYLFPSGNTTIQYGQQTYGTLAQAIDAIPTQQFIITPTSKDFGVIVGYIAITKGCTSLQDTTCSRIIIASKFGSTFGASGGITTLQQAYNNSSQPQTVTDATRGAVQYRRGSAADTDNVLEVLSGAGLTNFSVKGNGDTSISGDLFSGDHFVTGEVAASSTVTGSNLSGTNTGDDTIGSQEAGSIGVFKDLSFPNNQIVETNSTTKQFGIDNGNKNELYNGNFEAETLAVGWTISNATSSAETTNEFEGLKTLSLSLTGALSLSQSSTINAARKLGVQMVASLWVKSDDVSDLQLCSLKNGSEDKCTVTGGYVQGSGWRQLTVSFLGDATSNGLKLKSTDTTGTVLVDQAYVGVGSPLVDFTPDMVYSAKMSGPGVISDENTDFINGNCTRSGTNSWIATCNFNSGVFTVAPNCTATVVSNGLITSVVSFGPASASSVEFYTTQSSTQDDYAVNITCQKQGADYKTSKAYVASSSDYGWTSYTPTFTGIGTPTGVECFHKREGDSLSIRCNATSGTVSASGMSVSLPNSLTINTGKIPTGSSYVGSMARAATNAADYYTVLAFSSANTALYFGREAVGSFTALDGNVLLGNTEKFSFYAKVPITGWENTSVIVGSFQGYNETPGTSRVETFSFSYGTTNATTVCSASPCSYLDQIGNNVTNVTRGGAGSYTLNLTKTYSKLKCTFSGDGSAGYVAQGFGLSCSNCSTMPFNTRTAQTNTVNDAYGSMICQGIPQ